MELKSPGFQLPESIVETWKYGGFSLPDMMIVI